MKVKQTTEMTGTNFGYADTILYCRNSVRIDDANFLLQNFKRSK